MGERVVRIGVEIPLSLYANLDKIKNGSAASGRILEAVKNGNNAREAIRPVKIDYPGCGIVGDGWYDEATHLVFNHWVTKEFADKLGWRIEEDDNNG